MPFDALVMRGVTTAIAPHVVGGQLREVLQQGSTVYCVVVDPRGRRWHLEWVLTPRFRRIALVSHIPKAARPSLWAQALKGATILGTIQPPWERIWIWTLRLQDPWQPTAVEPSRLVLELAGHLTNALWVSPSGAVGDAFRRITPGRPGRVVWPGHPYTPPPPVIDPCASGDREALTPWARRYVRGDPTRFEDLCRQYQQGDFQPWVLDSPTEPELWVQPWTPDAQRAPDWSQAITKIFGRQEQLARLDDLRREILTHLNRRRHRIQERIQHGQRQLEEDALQYRRIGDAILTHGSLWEKGARPLTVPDPETGEPLALTWSASHASWKDLASDYYRRYKKSQATRAALNRLIPALEAELETLDRTRLSVQDTQDRSCLEQVLQNMRKDVSPSQGTLPFRRFTTVNGWEIWIGRNQAENQDLTFRQSRPDDLWFHVKNYPGSHVLLRCGKNAPTPEDLFDAAHLAAFYSRAAQGSMIPVDYTARKFVKKRPRAEPGQVLYTREKTLYVTPDPVRLERLGARRERLAQD